MATKLEDIYKMSIFEYDDLNNINILNEVELFRDVFEGIKPKEIEVPTPPQPPQPPPIELNYHYHPEVDKLGRNMRAYKNPLESSDKVISHSIISIHHEHYLYACELDVLIKNNKDSYFQKLLNNSLSGTKVDETK